MFGLEKHACKWLFNAIKKTRGLDDDEVGFEFSAMLQNLKSKGFIGDKTSQKVIDQLIESGLPIACRDIMMGSINDEEELRDDDEELR